MPKTSKVHKTTPKSNQKQNSSQPGDPVPKPERASFFCCRCGTEFKKQERNFPASQSTLFRGNGGYLPICNKCLDELYEHYKFTLGSDEEAIKRLCLKFDIYWHPKLYETSLSGNSASSRIRTYIGRSNLYRFIGKTYDNTLDEMNELENVDDDGGENDVDETKANAVGNPEHDEAQNSKTKDHKSVKFEDVEIEPRIITEEIRRYWGSGFTPEMYADLEDRREYWLSRYADGAALDPGEDALLKQICNLEIEINSARVSDKPIDRMVATLNSLIGSMNLKPSQKKEAEDLYIPFGAEILKWEEDDPVIEPDPDFQDVDGIHKHAISWYLGSMCKTVGIKNKYSEFFDEEIRKYTVERPEYDDDTEDEDYGQI